MSDWREFCSDWWLDKADRLTDEWADGVPVNWYANPTVWDCGLFSMDRDHAQQQASELGGFVAHAGPAPTPTDLNHLFHLWKANRSANSILEWGGGFGNTARIALNAGAQDYVIADIPIMSDLQRRFLVDPVALMVTPDGVPKWYGDNRPDLFLAAFSLDECTKVAHDFVFDHDWFGASTVLIVAQTEGKEHLFPDGPSLVARLRAAGFSEEPAMQTDAAYFKLVRP